MPLLVSKEVFMASRRFARKPPEDLCAAPGPDDGLDPRLAPRRAQGRVINRKALQLCRQVERILAGVLEGDLLRDLSVHSVMPAPDSSRLLVTFTFHGSDAIATADVLAALQAASAKLRNEIALGIHRKKTPELAFQVLRASHRTLTSA
jgi:ribosome-binding factor A